MIKRSARKLIQKAENGKLFTDVPTAILCSSIQMMLDELKQRGLAVKDFDHKEKHVEQLQLINNTVYFLTKGDDSNGEA